MAAPAPDHTAAIAAAADDEDNDKVDDDDDDDDDDDEEQDHLPPQSAAFLLCQVRKGCAGLHRLQTKKKTSTVQRHFHLPSRLSHSTTATEGLLDTQTRNSLIAKSQRYMDTLGKQIECFLTDKGTELRKIHKDMEAVMSGEKDLDFGELAHSYCSAMELPFPRPEPYLQAVWFTIFRLRFAFFLLCTFAILLSLFTGFLMEIFFSIIAVNPQGSSTLVWIKWHVIFWCLPFLMILLALLGDEMCDLMLDSFDDPPLHQFQGVLLTVLSKRATVSGSLYPSSRELKRLDWITFFVLEGVPVIISVCSLKFLTRFNQVFMPNVVGRMMFMGYVQGSLLSTLLATVLFVFCDAKANWRATKRLSRVDWVAWEIDRHKMNPYSLHAQFMQLKGQKDGLPNSLEALVGTENQRRGSKGSMLRSFTRQESERKGVLRDRKARYRMYFALLIWTAVVGLFAISTNKAGIAEWWDPVLVGVAVVLVVTLCSRVLYIHFRDIFGAPYVFILIFFILVGLSLNVSSAIKITRHSGSSMEAMMTAWPLPLPNGSQYDLPARWDGAAKSSLPGSRTQPYPLCEMSWGSPDALVRALDLASLAWIVYDSAEVPANVSQSHIAELVRESFAPERRVEVLAANSYMHLPRWAHFRFRPTGNSTRGTIVVAVKGTSTTMDVLVDTNLFSTVQVLQFFQTFLPVLTILPRLVIQWLLETVHLGTARSAEQLIWSDLEQEVRRLAREHPQDDIVFTGHSLGGGLAQIAATRMGLPAVVWSAPGAAYSAKRFGIEVQAMKRNVVSVMPDHDVVPRVDLQAGMLQLIECRLKNGAEANPPLCHLLLKTACEVWRVCGDSRDFRRTCSSHVAREDLGRLYAIDDSTS